MNETTARLRLASANVDLWVLTEAGWLLTVLLVAALTRLLRKD